MVILLSGRVHPGRRDDLVRFLREAVPFYEEPGNILTRLLTSTADPDHFVEVIEYADRSTYELDQERVASDPEMRAYLERWHSLLAEPPSVRIYEELTGEIHVRPTDPPGTAPEGSAEGAASRRSARARP